MAPVKALSGVRVLVLDVGGMNGEVTVPVRRGLQNVREVI